jgi:hypothetical protein
MMLRRERPIGGLDNVGLGSRIDLEDDVQIRSIDR